MFHTKVDAHKGWEVFYSEANPSIFLFNTWIAFPRWLSKAFSSVLISPKDKFLSFGFNVIEVKGNDIASLVEVFNQPKKVKNKPNLIIANTTKGAGISFMENQVSWHHKVPSQSEYDLAIHELNGAFENVQ